MITQLAYISSARYAFTPGELNTLLRRARATNEKHAVTGILLYGDLNFVQVLEGSAANVETVFQIVKRDQRHSQMIVVSKEEVSARDFPDWSMAYRDMSGQELSEIRGYIALNRNFVDELARRLRDPATRMFVNQFAARSSRW